MFITMIIFSGCSKKENIPKINDKFKETSIFPVRNLSIEVVYDNNPYKEGLKTAWGFSCFIEGTEKNILFDTGGNGELLFDNMKKLKIDPGKIDVVILSHIHGDHVGGLDSFLKENSNLVVYLPQSFPDDFKHNVNSYGAKVVEVGGPVKICKNTFSTGELGGWIKEQSLVIRTNKGLVVITGCAHPGIVKIVEKAKELVSDEVLLVMGGFHLSGYSSSEIGKIILSFKDIGVVYVGLCHCSGDTARRLFKEEFGKNYIDVGVGKKIDIN